MADLRSQVDSRFKEPTITVRIDGKSVRNVISADVSYSMNNSISSANLVFSTNPPAKPESKVTISQGYGGQETLVFTGLVDTIQQTEYSPTWTVTCRDMLKKAMDTFLVQRVLFGIDVAQDMFYYSTYVTDPGNPMNNGQFQVHEYNTLDMMHSEHPETVDNITVEGVKAEAVVQWLLHMSGLTEGGQIQVDDTKFFIGDIKPVDFIATSVYDAITQICDLINWYVYCDVSGVVRFKKRPRTSSGYSSWDYDTKSKYNILSSTFSQSNTDLRNYVEVHGASGIKVVRRSGSPYLGNTPYRGVLMANELIDTSGMATFIADRVLNDLNRLKETVSLEVDGNPFLFPGQSVRVQTRAANGTFLIEELSSNVSAEGGYKSTIQAASYPGDVTPEEDGEIKAAFNVLQVVSIGDPTYLVLFDGASSHSNRGAIVGWDWTFPNTADNSSGSKSQVWGSFEESTITSGNSATVTLTVHDEAGNSDTLTSGITLAALQAASRIMYRHLYAALTTRGVGSQDGGATWNTVEIPAVSVAASNFGANSAYQSTGYALFGGSDGKIYKTEDIAQSVREVASFGGRIDHVHIAELSGDRCLASTSNGELYRSADSGESWEKVHDFGAPVKQAEYGYKDFTYIVVITAGNNPGAYVSVDSGATFMHLTDFGAKEENWYAGGTQTPYYAYEGGVDASIPQPSGLAFAGGATPNVVAMTVNIENNLGVMAVDSDGQHWNFSGGVFNGTQANYTNQTRHMIRDGDISPLVYYATVEGVYKSLDYNKTILPMLTYSGEAKPESPSNSHPSTGWGEMVAYGPLAAPLPPAIGSIVVRTPKSLYSAQNPDRLYLFSGYTSLGTTAYQKADELKSGFQILLASGVGMCHVEEHQNAAGRKFALNRVRGIGPSYFIVDGARDSEVLGDVTEGKREMSLYAIDFTGLVSSSSPSSSGVVSSSKFYPKFYPVKWESRIPVGYSEIAVDYNIASPAKNPAYNLATQSKTRIYTICTASLMSISLNASMESFDIPLGALQSGDTLTSNTATPIMITDWKHAGRNGGFFSTEISRADTLMGTKFERFTMGDSWQNQFIASWDSAGVPTSVVGPPVKWLSTDGDSAVRLVYDVFNDTNAIASKYSTGWYTPCFVTDKQMPAVLGGGGDLTAFDDRSGTTTAEPEALGIRFLHASAIVPSDLYVVTLAHFYRGTAYGSVPDKKETLYTVPAADVDSHGAYQKWEIAFSSVTHDREYKNDFIVLVVRRTSLTAGNATSSKIVWSIDGGASWKESVLFEGNPIDAAWWIEP